MATSTEFMDTANNHITMPLVAAPHQLAGAMAIHEATRNKDFVALDRLLNENKSLIHAPDVVGRSPLMMSSLRGHVDVCEWLLDHGAPLNAVDINRRSAMYNAASYGFVQVVKLLMERGADPKIGDCEGNVPIIAAAYYGYEDVVRYLLDSKHGQDPDDLDRKGERRWTGLYLSCEAGYVKIARMFLQVGADPTIADNHGFTPLEVARKMSNWRCARLLERALREPARVACLVKAHALMESKYVMKEGVKAMDGRRGDNIFRMKTRMTQKNKYLEVTPPFLRRRVENKQPLPVVDIGGVKVISSTLQLEKKRRTKKRAGSLRSTKRRRGELREGKIDLGEKILLQEQAANQSKCSDTGYEGRQPILIHESRQKVARYHTDEEHYGSGAGFGSRTDAISSISLSSIFFQTLQDGKNTTIGDAEKEEEEDEVVAVTRYLVQGRLPRELFNEVIEMMTPRWMS